MKHNFVIFGSNSCLYRIAYKDLHGLKNSRYISVPCAFVSPFFKSLYRLHYSAKINRIIKLPFKAVWNPWYFMNDFNDKRPICFVFFIDWCRYEKTGLIKHLRKKYPKSKMVCFFQDLIASRKGLNINRIKNEFDLVISFDQVDCRQYGLEYHHLVYSDYPIEKSPHIPESDVYFLGKAKNRLCDIIQAYECLKSHGLVCDFYLVGVEKKEQKYPDEISYIEEMSYEENLLHIVSTNIILEIMQENGTGYTQRMCEAIAYNKKLLTNNMEIRKAPFYNSKYISTFANPAAIAPPFLKHDVGDIIDYAYKDKLSPKHLLSFIEGKLMETQNYED